MSTGRTLRQLPDASWRCPQHELAADPALVIGSGACGWRIKEVQP